jgi:cell division protein FtsQ
MTRGAFLRRALPATAGVAAPADKRFRRPDVRPGRRRRFGMLLWRLTRIALMVSLIGGAASWTVNAILGATPLSIDRFVVGGNRRLSRGEVEALINGVRGQNILLVNLDQARERLMDSPWVAGATLRRVLPSTIEVRVVERVPMAIARLNQQLYLVDNTGIIIDEFGPQYREFDLPVVDGLARTPVDGGSVVDASHAQLTGRLLDELRSAPGVRQRISQIDVSDARDAVVLLDNDTALVHLGESRFVDRLKSYLDLAPTLQEHLHDIDYVDMRFDARVYVRSRGRAMTLATGKQK